MFQHLIGQDKFKETGFAGYEIPKNNSEGYVIMAAFNSDTHICLTKELYDELLKYKSMFDDLSRGRD